MLVEHFALQAYHIKLFNSSRADYALFIFGLDLPDNRLSGPSDKLIRQHTHIQDYQGH